MADAYPANTTTTGFLPPNSSITSSIETAGDTDWIAVSLHADQTYIIDLEGADTLQGTLADPIVRFYDNAGVLVSGAWDNNGGVGLNSRLVYRATTSALFYLSVAASGTGTGNYRLSSTMAPSATDDYSSSTVTIGSLAVGAGITGAVNSSGDADWFRVSLAAGQTYIIDLEGSTPGLGTLVDPRLNGVHNTLGTLLSGTANNNGGSGLNSRLVFTAASTGNYYISAGSNDTYGGVYWLTLRQAASATDDYANSISTTGRLGVGLGVTGAIESTSESDWFRINLAAAQTYIIELEGIDTFQGTLVDPFLRGLCNNGGTYIAGTQKDGGGTGQNSRLLFTTTTLGVYFISAAGYGSSQGTYRLSVTQANSATDDYADSTATRGVLAVGGGIAGAIETASDVDWFSVGLRGGRTYVIDLQGAPTGHGTLANPYLRGIYNGSGALIAGTEADNGGTGLNSRLTFTTTASGTYYLAAIASGTGTGTYRLTVNQASSSTDDYAASTATAGRLALGGSVTGAVDVNADVDWFRVDLTAGLTYSIDLQGSPTGQGTLADTYLQGVYNHLGVRALNSWNDNDGTGANSHINFLARTTGIYYIAAKAAGNGTGTYRLTVSRALDDYAETTATVGYLAAGASITGSISAGSETDWFRMTLLNGKTYTFDLQGSSTSKGTLADPIIRGIYTSSGALIAGTTADDGGTGNNSRLTYTATATGTYYLSAGSDNGGLGSYTLSASQPDDFLSSTATTGVVSVGGGVSGSIGAASETDWFRVNLAAGQSYTIDLMGGSTSQGTLTDPYLRGVYDSAGTLIAGTAADDGGTGTNSRLQFTASSAGSYYISAGGDGSATGTYRLTVVQAASGSDDFLASTATTGRVAAGGTVAGRIESVNDIDWFRVALTAGQTYVIDLQGSSTSQGTLGDPYFRGVYNSAGVLSPGTAIDDGGTVNNSRRTFTPSVTGNYYLAAGADGGGLGTYRLSVSQPRPWTMMVYVDGDNNLEQAGVNDVNEMEAANNSPRLTTTCIFDRSDGYSVDDGNWTNTRQAVIRHDTSTTTMSSLTTDMAEQDMGNGTTLTNFINWSAIQNPSANSALVLWDHGGGIHGSCWDDTNNSNLSMTEVATAISNSNLHRVNLLAFDACNMGVLDQAYAVRNVADFMVASQDTIPFDGYEYTGLINQFSAAAVPTTQILGDIMVSTYDADYSDPITLAALDLSQMNALTASMNTFATTWQSSGLSATLLRTARNGAQSFGGGTYIDLYHFMQRVQVASTSASVDTAAQGVINSVDAMVTSNTDDFANGHGLSIYMPATRDITYLTSGGTGSGADLASATGWTSVYNTLWGV